MNKTKNFLKEIGIDEEDSNFESNKTFSDGGQFRFEVPGIQGPLALESLLNNGGSFGWIS